MVKQLSAIWPSRLRQRAESNPLYWRQQGDMARNASDWPSAILAYKKHLALNADDAAIWVQLGHALKESSRLLEALAAYEQSVILNADDADRDAHLSHLRLRVAREAAPQSGAGTGLGQEGPVRSERVGATPEVVDATLIAARLQH